MDFSKAQFERAYGTFSQLPASLLPEIVFSGRSNVGKSSLINKVFNRKNLARVSSVPGKTVTINFYSVGGDAKIVDLPGYGYAKVAKTEKDRWAKMMEGYFNSGRNISLVVQLVDMRHPPTADDIMMIDFLTQTGYPYIVALTKSDKLNKTEYKTRLEAIKTELPTVEKDRIIPFSALNGEGAETIRNYIIKYSGGSK
ncbi:MAG TPA: YihA family ribosome biogenesis GTP-binding protein [Ruminococcaceae bacterium]|nr:YihA family ribosome biogenesis GTP-binding protein [Oscillospiraceae bacterium]